MVRICLMRLIWGLYRPPLRVPTFMTTRLGCIYLGVLFSCKEYNLTWFNHQKTPLTWGVLEAKGRLLLARPDVPLVRRARPGRPCMGVFVAL